MPKIWNLISNDNRQKLKRMAVNFGGGKKLFKDMTQEEIGRIYRRLCQLELTISDHAQLRMIEQEVDKLPNPVNCRIIEFNCNNNDARVVLRNGDGIVFVVSLRNGLVLTVWKNEPDDEHQTLWMPRYSKDIPVSW